MTADLQTAAIALFNAVTSILYTDYFYSTFSERKSKTAWVSLAAFVLFFLSPMLISNKLVNSAVLALLTFGVTFRYRMPFYNRILLTAVSVALNIVVEIATGFLVMFLFYIDFALVKTGAYLVLGTVFTKFAVFWIYFIVRLAKKRTLYGRFRKSWTALFVLPAATIVVTYSLFLAMPDFKDEAVSFATAGGLMLLVVANVLIFSLIDGIASSIEQESQLAAAKTLIGKQEEQYRLITERNELVMKLRHEYKNALVGMLADIERNDTDAAKKQIGAQLGVLSSSAPESISGNSVLDTILRFKTEAAAGNGVTVRSRFHNVQQIPIPSVDLAILLGNALDNAAEAAALLTDGREKAVELFICVKDGHLNIKVTNPVVSDKDVTRLRSGKDGAHGYGIINMNAIAEKHHGSVTFFCENCVFTTIIMI